MATTYPILLGSIAEVTIRSIVDSQNCMSVFHYLYTGTTITDGAAGLGRLLGALNGSGHLVSAYAGLMGTNVSMPELRGQIIYSIRYIPTSVTPAPATGQWGTDCNNPSACATILKRGLSAGPSGRGVIHLPGLPDDAMDGGNLLSAFITAQTPFKARLVEVVHGATGEDWQPIIYHRANPAASQYLAAAVTQPTIRTMKRRVVGRGI